MYIRMWPLNTHYTSRDCSIRVVKRLTSDCLNRNKVFPSLACFEGNKVSLSFSSLVPRYPPARWAAITCNDWQTNDITCYNMSQSEWLTPLCELTTKPINKQSIIISPTHWWATPHLIFVSSTLHSDLTCEWTASLSKQMTLWAITHRSHNHMQGHMIACKITWSHARSYDHKQDHMITCKITL